MKTIRHLLILTLGLCATAHAQTVSPVPAPTIITTQPYTISKPGYYQLGANLVSSASSGDIITIASGNVTLDFAGHFISGPSTMNSSSLINGVHANEEGNIKIINGTIAFCYCGINLEGNGQTGSLNINQHVENMLVSYCYYQGISFSNASNSVASNCQVSFTGNNTNDKEAYGISVRGGSANQIINDTISNTVAATGVNFAYGIFGSTDTTIIGNVVINVTAPGGVAYGIEQAAFADHNKVYNSQYGLYNVSKYSDNLTVNCTTPFSADNGFTSIAVGNGNN